MQFSSSLSVLALMLSVTLLLQGCGDDNDADAAAAGCSDSSKVCVQIKPFGAGNQTRRLGMPYMSDQTEFACRAGSEATCDASMCTADKFRIQGAFMISDTHHDNPAWEACGFVRMIKDGEQQAYDLDLACGCADEAEYLAQVHSADTASCGIVNIGLDVYTQNEAWGDSAMMTENITIDGEEWFYIRQNDLPIAPDLVTVITGVKSGTQAAGVYTYGYTYDMPSSGESGCQVTYRVDITVPESYVE